MYYKVISSHKFVIFYQSHQGVTKFSADKLPTQDMQNLKSQAVSKGTKTQICPDFIKKSNYLVYL